MSRNKKTVAILLSMLFALSVCSITAFAADLDSDGYDDDTGEPIEQSTEYVTPTSPASAVTEPYVPETTVYVPPATEAPVQSSNDYQYSDNYYSSSNDNYYSSSQSYYSSSSSANYYIDENGQSSYLGGGQVYVQPDSTAPSAALYDDDENVDTNELSSKDWDEIVANLSDASEGSSDGDDFSFIQNNTSTSDDGEIILIAGIACLVLSAAGIVYVVISSVNAGRSGSTASSVRRPAYAGAPSGSSRSRSDYDDGYKAESAKKNAARRSKFDTADVKLPKSKGKGNNRYR